MLFVIVTHLCAVGVSAADFDTSIPMRCTGAMKYDSSMCPPVVGSPETAGGRVLTEWPERVLCVSNAARSNRSRDFDPAKYESSTSPTILSVVYPSACSSSLVCLPRSGAGIAVKTEPITQFLARAQSPNVHKGDIHYPGQTISVAAYSAEPESNPRR